MIKPEINKKIYAIWDNFVKTNKLVVDAKGKEIPKIEESRIQAIFELKRLIKQFIEDNLDLMSFKTNIDSFNKKNNLWGFTATKGQMFFNQLVKYSPDDVHGKLTSILQKAIKEPDNLNNALEKLDCLRIIVMIFSLKLWIKEKLQILSQQVISYLISGKFKII